MPRFDFIKAMETFYGRSFTRYTLSPSLTIPKGMGFGLRYSRNNHTNVFNAFGAFDFQNFKEHDKLSMGFRNPQRLIDLSIHEFGHSFVNPVIDKVPPEKIVGTEKLFQPIKSAMNQQGYNTWKVSLYEHFVRAGEIVIVKLYQGDTVSERLRSDYEGSRKFIYLPTIIQELERYSKGKTDYYNTVMKVFDELASRKETL